MSEYQYYEFVSVDEALTPKQQRELRQVSSRGEITSSSFVNEYEWGDLKADTRDWMERHFDAHLYLANWGTHRIVLRLPQASLEPATVTRYCVGGVAETWVTSTHVFLDVWSEDEDVEEWDEPSGQLTAIVPARAELAAGDLRLLYLAWLLVVQSRELDENEVEPPVPAGLGKLSGPQRAFAEFLRLDVDLLAAAADPTDRGRRTVGELLAGGEKAWDRRHELIRSRKLAEGRRKREAAASAQAQRLEVLARHPADAWTKVDSLIETKRAYAYDQVVVLLGDLRMLAAKDDDVAGFTVRMSQLREQHARKQSLIDRLDRAKLP
jgi:hypothetical protein